MGLERSGSPGLTQLISVFLRMTFSRCFCLNSMSFSLRVLSVKARICTASKAAFLAPAFPIPIVATGIPGGI